MSELLSMPGPECSRTVEMLPAFVDCDVTVVQSAWLEAHLETCAECRAALDEFAQLDCELTDWGQRLANRNPPPPHAREQLAAKLQGRPVRHRSIRWIAASAAAIAAVVAIAVLAPRQKPQLAEPAPPSFVGIPYLPPLDPRENSAIVQMNLRVATLIAAGYRVDADPDQVVPADVLVGEDGRAHAVRLRSDVVLN